MFKIIYFMWRRADMSCADFAHYYEDKHTHNNARIRPASKDYRRNYPLPDSPLSDRGALARLGDFDVMSENSYVDRAGFAVVLDAIRQSPARELIAEDEARFEIRESKRVFVVDERGGLTPDAADYEARALRNEAKRVKLLRFLTRSSLTPLAEFRERYETEQVPVIAGLLDGCIDYRRNHILFDDPMSFAGSHHAPTPADETTFPASLVEEIWFDSEDAAAQGRRRLATLAADPLVVLDATCLLAVTECRTPRPQAAAI